MSGIRELPVALLEKSKKELHEDPGRRAEDIAHIREWLKKQPHIRANPDDQTLIAFLRGCKFSLERTKEKIDTYYTLRSVAPEMFKDSTMNNEKIKELLSLGLYVFLPQVDDNGSRILIVRPGVTDPGKHKIEDQFKLNFMMTDMLVREDDEMVVNGIVSIIDLSGVTLGHASQMSPTLVKKVMVISQDGYPIRPKGIHYVHTPPMFDTIFNLFKSFAKEKIKKRLIVHGDNMESLYKCIPQRFLPSEYGGQAGSIKDINAALIKRLDSYNDWFVKNADAGVDESKRHGKPKTQKELFGLEGSFRKLTLD